MAGAQRLGFGVYRFAQSLARFEVGYTLLGNGHRLACAGIAPHAGRPAIDRKTAKTAYFYPVAAHQCITHRVQNRLYGEFGITLGKLVELRSQGFY